MQTDLEYAIDNQFYSIFDGLNIDKDKLTIFITSFHELLRNQNKISKSEKEQERYILKAELKDELLKELATKADIQKLDFKIINLNTRIDELEKRLEVQFNSIERSICDFKDNVNDKFGEVNKRFEQVDKRFEQVDKRFEQVDKRFDKMDKHNEKIENKLDKLFFTLIGFMGSFIIGIVFLLIRFGNFD